MRLAVANTRAKRVASLRGRFGGAVAVPAAGVDVRQWRGLVWLGRFEDSPLRFFVLPGDALGVGAQQYVYGVPCPFGDLCRVSAGVEPGGHGGVPQVVGATSDAASASVNAAARALWKTAR